MNCEYKKTVDFLSQKMRVTNKNEIEVNIVQSHCGGEVCETTKINLPLNEEGRQTVELLIKIFDYVKDSIEKNNEQSTDDIALKVSEQFELNYEKVFKFLNCWIRSNGDNSDGCAIPESYSINVYYENELKKFTQNWTSDLELKSKKQYRP